MKKQITDLEDQISRDEHALKVKKLTLSVLKERQSSHKLFSETKFGKFLCDNLRTITKPLAKLNKNLENQLTFPNLYKRDKLFEKSSKLLEKAALMNRNKFDSKSNKMTARLANCKEEIESYREQQTSEDYSLLGQVKKLEAEIDRLRPPKNQQKIDEITKELDKIHISVNTDTGESHIMDAEEVFAAHALKDSEEVTIPSLGTTITKEE